MLNAPASNFLMEKSAKKRSFSYYKRHTFVAYEFHFKLIRIPFENMVFTIVRTTVSNYCFVYVNLQPQTQLITCITQQTLTQQTD